MSTLIPYVPDKPVLSPHSWSYQAWTKADHKRRLATRGLCRVLWGVPWLQAALRTPARAALVSSEARAQTGAR